MDSHAATSEPPARIVELDALRGIMALLVVFYHFTTGLHLALPEVPTTGLSLAWGEYGVQGFFAISGFVIMMTLDRTERASDFIVSRFSRLFPAFWVSVAVTSLVVTFWGPSPMQRSASDIAANLSMIPTLLGAAYVDSSYWTLELELGFYAVTLGLWRLGLLEHIEKISLCLMAVLIACHFDPGANAWIQEHTKLYHIPFFLVGLFSYRIWRGRRTFVQQLPVFSLAGLTLFLPQLELTIVFVGCVLMMVALIEGSFAWLRHPVALWLGAISYPLYLLHQFVGYTIIVQLSGFGTSPLVSTGIALGTVIGLACLLHLSIEKPLQLAIRRWWKRRTRVALGFSKFESPA